MDLLQDGAVCYAHVLTASDRDYLDRWLGRLPAAEPGHRLTDLASLDVFGSNGPIGAIAADLLGSKARPVRAILFDKTAANNWALGWHQDRTIAVASRGDVPGFDHWTEKQGIQHVEPPFEILSAMLTFRVHLDPVHVDNGPLLIAPGSHRDGKIMEVRIPDIIEQRGSFACLARAGDIWVYGTPILHASGRSSRPSRRRVLQLNYTAVELPHPLTWPDLLHTTA